MMIMMMMIMMMRVLMMMTMMVVMTKINDHVEVQDITRVTWRKGGEVLDLHTEERVR